MGHKTDRQSIDPHQLGGEVEQQFKYIKGDTCYCSNCGNEYTVTEKNIFAQQGSQKNSIVDSDGTVWLVDLLCLNCGYAINSTEWASL